MGLASRIAAAYRLKQLTTAQSIRKRLSSFHYLRLESSQRGPETLIQLVGYRSDIKEYVAAEQSNIYLHGFTTL